MRRLRLFDLRTSDAARAVGKCQGDIAEFAQLANSAQRRLLYAKESGDEGWWGTWAEMVFEVTKANPYLVLPRDVARVSALNLCESPIPVENQWYEYLRFGNGRLPKNFKTCPGRGGFPIQMLARNPVPTQVEMTDPPNLIRIYPANVGDVNKRVLLQGEDSNGVTVTSQDVTNHVQGIFVTMLSPFETSPIQFNKLTGVQKGITLGRVQFFQVNPTTGVETLLLTMEPSEKTAWYRRYFISGVPNNCCNATNSGTVQLHAIVKLDLIPVQTDTDYLLIQNQEALVEEMQSVRYSRMDSTSAKQMAQEKHIQAIRLLNGELNHFLGKDDPAIQFKPFGSATLNRLNVKMI